MPLLTKFLGYKKHNASETGLFGTQLQYSRHTRDVVSVFSQESGRSKVSKVDNKKSVWEYCCWVLQAER